MSEVVIWVAIGVVALLLLGALIMIMKCYRKVRQGYVLIRNGLGGTKISFSGMVVFPVIHYLEEMDMSVKRVEIDRAGTEGLVCKDNLRADVKVAFFVRVNKTANDVLKVSQSLGCKRASDPQALVEFFDAKFSEALKTVGKQFDFVELYVNRDRFKEEILKVIGTDLNGYVLDDAAIDYLEQTKLSKLDPENILDAEGIKKITELTAREAVKANDITREKEKTIKKQDVEAREAILELEKQQADAEQRQKREIAEITARQEAQAKKVQAEELLKSERARITAEEEIQVAEENKQRQVIVARKNKERTDAVETERVEKDRGIEATERERVVTLAQIEKDKAVEVEKKAIQDVIRERVAVERTVVEEEEHIKDTRAFAGAERAKKVAVVAASQEAEEKKVKLVTVAEGEKEAAKLNAEEVTITAEGNKEAAERDADAKKMIADAVAAERAAPGLAEAQVMLAKADAIRKTGDAEAEVMQKKFHAEAQGIEDKAAAMKKFDSVGREHEEFKLELNKDLEVELANITVRKDIAKEQAEIMGQALKSARIDIVGGEAQFFDKIVSAVTGGKAVDRYVDSSHVLTNINQTLLSGDGEHFKHTLKKLVGQFGLTSADVKNLSVAALLGKLTAQADEAGTRVLLEKLAAAAKEAGLADEKASKLL